MAESQEGERSTDARSGFSSTRDDGLRSIMNEKDKAEITTIAREPQGVDLVVQDPSTNPLKQWFDSIMKPEEGNQPQDLKIAKVPYMLKNKSNEKDYHPKVVSIGPYHRDTAKVKEMQKRKLAMVRQFVEQSEQSIEEIYSKVKELYIGTQKAEECYGREEIAKFKGEEFTQMMFIDGCFILQFIFSVMENPNNLKISNQEAAYVRRDLFLLENQLPYEVLKKLLSLRPEKDKPTFEKDRIIKNFIKIPEPLEPVSTWLFIACVAVLIVLACLCIPIMPIILLFACYKCRDVDALFVVVRIIISVVDIIVSFASRNLRSPRKRHQHDKNEEDHVHLLDHLYAQLIDKETKPDDVPENQVPYLYYSPKDLKKVGIYFKPSRTSALTDVEFKTKLLSGILKLPPLTIDESTQALLLNLVAYESCTYESNKHWATAYICFMDSLINDAEDVKLLRSSGIIHNFLGTDEQVAAMFNGMASGLVPHPFAYGQVKKKINEQCKSIIKKWIAEFLEFILGVLGPLLQLLVQLLPSY